MHLRSISIENWRNITHISVHLPSGPIVVVGANGQGKTSLLEAIYLLGHTRSFRPSRFTDFLHRTIESVAEKAVVTTEVETNDGAREVKYVIEDGKRHVWINSKRIQAASSFFGAVRVIEFTPDDLYLIKGSPAERRPLLDKLLAAVDPLFVDALVGYNRALRHRNILLAKAQGRELSAVRRELESFSIQLATYGREIALRRKRLTSELSEDVAKFYSELFSRSDLSESAGVAYKSSVVNDDEVVSEAEMLKEFELHLDQDVRLKSTSYGVHRDDLILQLDAGFGLRKARQIASQGQTRTLAIALKMAGTEFIRRESGETPIVLLDDVESELDEARRDALFTYLSSIEAQIIVATTGAEHVPPSFRNNAKILKISSGSLAC